MPKFSKTSLKKLETCHPDIQKVMHEAIKHYDFTVGFGHRTPEEQLALFKKGRAYSDGKWIKVGRIVTNLDGTYKKSKHNYNPSLAIDIMPYPVDWKNIDRFIELKDVVFKAAETVGVELVWGADWDGDGDIAEHSLQDYPHYELKKV